MKVIVLYALLAVACAQELDTHGDPFAKPPYSWTALDTSSYKVEINFVDMHSQLLYNLC